MCAKEEKKEKYDKSIFAEQRQQYLFYCIGVILGQVLEEEACKGKEVKNDEKAKCLTCGSQKRKVSAVLQKFVCLFNVPMIFSNTASRRSKFHDISIVITLKLFSGMFCFLLVVT